MNIGQKIKKLRQENNLTQEELAEQLNVSFQAVSRWENSITFPDITMLPIIATMFDVTIDYLLDMDSYKTKDEIDKVLGLDLIWFNQGKTKEREELLQNALKKYPNHWDLKDRLLCVYFTIAMNEATEEYAQKTIKLAHNILEKCVDDAKRYSAMQTLVLMYRARKELDKAKEIVEKLPKMIISRDWLWPDVVTGEERIKAVQHNFDSLVELFHSRLITTYGREEVGKRDVQLLKYKGVLDIVFEDGDYGFNHKRLSDIYMMCAKDQACIKNKEKTIDYLNQAVEHLVIWLNMYRSKIVLRHTSFLVDRLEDDPSTWLFSDDSNNSKRMIKELEINIFDFIRENEQFKQIIEQLKKA